MNKNLLIIIGVLIILGGGAFFLLSNKPSTGMPETVPQTTNTQGTLPVAGNSVEISNFAFNPKSITVKVGASITWTNKDAMGHSATSDNGSFDTGVLAQGESKTLTLNKVGTYAYHCSLHPNMKATVTVTN